MRRYVPESVNGKLIGRIPKASVDLNLQNWEKVVVCQIVGGFPPFQMVDTFFRKVWKNLDVERVWMVKPGWFMVRLGCIDHVKKVLSRGLLHYENKPVLVYPWQQDFDYEKPAKIPVWVQLHGLNVVYWTPEMLSIILSPLGVPKLIDRATLNVERLGYARVQIEVEVQDAVPDVIEFIDEHGRVQQQKLTFEWFPIKCAHCSMLGHGSSICKRQQQQAAAAKIQPVQAEEVQPIPEQAAAAKKPEMQAEADRRIEEQAEVVQLYQISIQ
jgi:hypothetical protein